VLRDGDDCVYMEEEAIRPLWKGRRFPMRDCISGWVMTHGQPVVVPDIFKVTTPPTASSKRSSRSPIPRGSRSRGQRARKNYIDGRRGR
jgi:hypothetical protein